MWDYSLQRQVFSERLLSLDTPRRSAEKATISPLPVSINFFTAKDMVWVIGCCKNDHWIFLNQWTGPKTLPTNIPKEVFSSFFSQHELVQEVVSSLLCKKFDVALLPPAKEVCKGYDFTPVCHSVHGGGGLSAPVHAWIHPPPRADPSGRRHLPRSRHPPGADTPPRADTPGADTPLRSAGWKMQAVSILLECILI